VDLKLNNFKNKLSGLKDIKGAKKSKDLSKKTDPSPELVIDSKIDESPVSKDKVVPQFMSISKLDFDKYDVRAGLIKDASADGGIRYQIIEPILTERDEKALEIIKKLLMTELSVSMGEIKSKKEAEYRLGAKIDRMIKNYRLSIPKKNIAKIKYYAIRDFVHLGKIEPLMRDHMIEEISCDGTGIPLYIWHRELESIPTNIMFEINAFGTSIGADVNLVSVASIESACIEEKPP